MTTDKNPDKDSDKKVDTVHPLAVGLPTDGREIERRSHQMIDEQLAAMDLTPAVLPIARRVIHATADFTFGESLRVHPQAIDRAVAAIAARRPIVCDVRMVQAGITKTGCEVLCAVSDPEVIRRAKAQGCTRSAAAMEFLAEKIDGAIVAVGNAPTALWKILELAAKGTVRPAVVVGLPVGFVGASESKQALLESDLCYITNIGPRGGSPVAAAAVNALAMAARAAENPR
ncbi:MAG TPA: precorrin-8X methylmutase [Thermoguttaceae bacterium]|nr:precorrin-8X methylmutase [Thermoguttaceae bacterium]